MLTVFIGPALKLISTEEYGQEEGVLGGCAQCEVSWWTIGQNTALEVLDF